MGATDRYSPDDVQRILGLTEKQLDYWDRLRLVSPQKEKGARFYDFRDLIGLRTIKQLVEKGVPPVGCSAHLLPFTKSWLMFRFHWPSFAFFPTERRSLLSARVHDWNLFPVNLS